MAKIQGAAEKIRRQLEIIEGETDKARQGVRKMVDDAKQTLLALNIVLDDEEAERASPISVELAPPVMFASPANDASARLVPSPAG